jgi:DNA-binding transcriptional MocR family regulator
MPDFHNPAGHVMSAPGRAVVAEAAAAAGTRLVIDETFAELALGAPGEQPLPAPLAAFDPAGQVITIGSMSKAFWGGLRVGWVRADPGLVVQLQAARGPSDLASPVVEQLAAAWLLDRADSVLPARRELLTGRRDTLAAALASRLPAWQVRLPAGGLSLWARLEAPVSSALVHEAERHLLRLVPGPRFGAGGSLEQYLRLPFSLPGPDLAEAVTRLATAQAGLRHAAPPPPRSAPPQVA